MAIDAVKIAVGYSSIVPCSPRRGDGVGHRA